MRLVTFFQTEVRTTSWQSWPTCRLRSVTPLYSFSVGCMLCAVWHVCVACVACLQTHGFPKVMGVLTHLDLFKSPKKLRQVKKQLKSRFWTEIYQVRSLCTGLRKRRCVCECEGVSMCILFERGCTLLFLHFLVSNVFVVHFLHLRGAVIKIIYLDPISLMMFPHYFMSFCLRNSFHIPGSQAVLSVERDQPAVPADRGYESVPVHSCYEVPAACVAKHALVRASRPH